MTPSGQAAASVGEIHSCAFSPNLRPPVVSNFRVALTHWGNGQRGACLITAWHEDDSLWESIAPFLFTVARCGEGAKREVEQVLTLLELTPGAPILDLCCGPGRHSFELARRQYSVTGVDRTAAYLETASRKANQEGLAIEFLRSDARAFRRPAAFDAVLNLFTSFGYFESEEDDLALLTNVRESLRPRGQFVIELNGKEVFTRHFHPRTWHPNADGTAFLLEERTVRSGWAYVDNCWRVLDVSGSREYRFPIRVYSGHELEALLRRAGFSEVTLYGSLAGTPYDHAAERLVAVARK